MRLRQVALLVVGVVDMAVVDEVGTADKVDMQVDNQEDMRQDKVVGKSA